MCPPTGWTSEIDLPTLDSGLGRGWDGIWPFQLAAGGALVLAAWATPRLRLSNRSLAIGLLVLVGWCLFAVLAPTVLGIDHAGLESIVKAGDNTALSTVDHPTFSSYPLKVLAPIAAVCGLLALGGGCCATRAIRHGMGRRLRHRRRRSRFRPDYCSIQKPSVFRRRSFKNPRDRAT